MRVWVLDSSSAAVKIGLIYTKMPLIWFVYAYTFDFLLISIGDYFTYQRKGRSVFKWTFQFGHKKLLGYS